MISWLLLPSDLYGQEGRKTQKDIADEVAIQQVLAKIKQAEATKNTTQQMDAYHEVAVRYTNSRLYTEAEDYLLKELQLAQTKKDYMRQGNAQNQLALVYSANNQFEQAFASFGQAIHFFKKTQSWKKLIKCHIDWGEFYRAYGIYDKALHQLNEAEKWYREKNMQNPQQLARIFNRKAAVYDQTQQLTEAINYSHKAIQIARKIKDNSIIASSYNELGYVYKKN